MSGVGNTSPPVATAQETAAQPTRTQSVLTPASLRLDSRVLFATATSTWLANLVFCVLLLYKLDDENWASTTWWGIFSPMFVGHFLHVAVLGWVLSTVNRAMEQQLGPPPNASASVTVHTQYAAMRSMRIRSHVVDNVNGLFESIGLLAVKFWFAGLLQAGTFQAASMRTVFAPIWAAWGVTLVTLCFKHPRERIQGSHRDLLNVFLLMVAFKVDGKSSLSWQMVFIIPWLWLSGALLLGLVVGVSLGCARACTRPKELLVPIGFFMLLVSTGVPHAAFCMLLVSRLDGNLQVSPEDILLPSIVGWAAMWVSAVVLSAGLARKEQMRALLMASGAVWTSPEHEAAALRQDLDVVSREQRRLGLLPVEELVALAQTQALERGRPPPLHG